MKLNKKDSLPDQKMQVKAMHTILNTLKKFDFTQSDLTDDEFRVLLNVLLDDEDVYSNHKKDIGRRKQKFHIPLKRIAIS